MSGCMAAGRPAWFVPFAALNLHEFFGEFPLPAVEEVEHGLALRFKAKPALSCRSHKDAREIGQAATLMYAMTHAWFTQIFRGNYQAANALGDELLLLADEKSAALWKAAGTMNRGCVLALTGRASDAVHIITSGIAAMRSTGATMWIPLHLSYLTRAHAELGQFRDDGVALRKRSRRSKQLGKDGSKPRSIEQPVCRA
jgi:hypothetical protein